MIVPFSDIPTSFLTPLSVDTDARYTLDMKKFPGLSSDGLKEPALIPAPEKVITHTTDNDRESFSEQLCLSSRTVTPVTSTCFNSCHYRSQQSTTSLFDAQKELYQLLESYQMDYPEVSSIVSNSAVTDRRPVSSRGNCMDSFPRSINQNREMCVLSPGKMLSARPIIESCNRNVSDRTGKFVSCVRQNETQAYLSNGGIKACRYHNGSLPNGVFRDVTGQSCACSCINDISDCGVRQGFAFTQPLFEPVLSSCRLAAFPTPDYINENTSPFDTHPRFVKTSSCSFGNRAVPYTSRRNVSLKRMSSTTFCREPNSSQYISPVINESVLNFNFFPFQNSIINSNQCLRV